MRKLTSMIFLSLLFSQILQPVFAQPFEKLSYRAGLQYALRGNGVAAADYNNDGHIDLYFVTVNPTTSSHAGSENMLLMNFDGKGTFINAARHAGVVGVGNTATEPQNKLIENHGASWGDFDNDGDVDLYLTNKGVDELYENLGDGTFKDITQAAGLDRLIRDSSSAVWVDIDNDGDLDLYVSTYQKHGLPASCDNVMYRNNGDGTFADITTETGLGESGHTYTTMVLDANSDNWPDLYCVNDFGPNTFYLNKGDGTYREATSEYGLENDGHGMGVTVGDYDNDGLFDIYLTNIADDLEGEYSPLFRHSASGRFQDVTAQTGTGITNWAWGCEFFDYDLDGDLDLYVVNGIFGNDFHNYFFKNNGNGTFQDFSEECGADSKDEARGLSVADFNNDGKLDMVVANLQASADMYLNSTENGNYLKINLIGTQSNRDARGAIVRIKANNKNYHRTNDGVEFFGQSKVPIHFGLADAETVQRLSVEWPSGIHEEFENINANQTITIQEEFGIVTGVTTKEGTSPKDFTLLNNYPNPLKSHTYIRFRTNISSDIKIEVYDILGRLVAIPVFGRFTAGEHTISWAGNNTNGHPLPSGIYLQKLSARGNISYGKLIILR